MRTCTACNTADKLALTCPNCGGADWSEFDPKPGAPAGPKCVCGALVSKGAIACHECGASLIAVEPQPAEPPREPEPKKQGR